MNFGPNFCDFRSDFAVFKVIVLIFGVFFFICCGLMLHKIDVEQKHLVGRKKLIFFSNKM